MTKGSKCDNLNHRRTDAPVRFCPRCGEVVNENIPTAKCTADTHVRAGQRWAPSLAGSWPATAPA